MIRKRTLSAAAAGVGALALGVAFASPASANTASITVSCPSPYGSGTATISTYSPPANSFSLTTTMKAPANIPGGLGVDLTANSGAVKYSGSTIHVLSGQTLLFNDFQGPATPTSVTVGTSDHFVIHTGPPPGGVGDITCSVTSGATLTWP